MKCENHLWIIGVLSLICVICFRCIIQTIITISLEIVNSKCVLDMVILLLINVDVLFVFFYLWTICVVQSSKFAAIVDKLNELLLLLLVFFSWYWEELVYQKKETWTIHHGLSEVWQSQDWRGMAGSTGSKVGCKRSGPHWRSLHDLVLTSMCFDDTKWYAVQLIDQYHYFIWIVFYSVTINDLLQGSNYRHLSKESYNKAIKLSI